MIGLMVFYVVILVVVLVKWLFIRHQLWRGLDMAFIQIRKTNELESIFKVSAKQYYFQLVWLVVAVFVTGFCAYRLLALFDVLHVESAVVLAVVVLLFARDSYHYLTALFFVKRMK